MMENKENILPQGIQSGSVPFLWKDGDGAMLFASEAKNLVGLCNKITPFPPGYYYDGEQFVCYHDITKVDSFCNDDLETICKNIREKINHGD